MDQAASQAAHGPADPVAQWVAERPTAPLRSGATAGSLPSAMGRSVAEPGDPYKILQVDPEAEDEVIQAAYRRLARKYHPDLRRAPRPRRGWRRSMPRGT